MHTREQAQTFGDKLAARLGANWQVRIWENLGWHTAVYLEGTGLAVHFNHGWGIRPTTFTAFLNTPEAGPHSGGMWAQGGDTPEQAIENTLSEARAEVAKKQSAITAADRALEASRKLTWEAPVAT